MSVADDIARISTDSASLATATATAVAALAAIAPLQLAVTNAGGTVTADNAQLSTDLQAGGPAFVLNADGSAAFYQFSATAPGFTVVQAQPAANVPSTPPPTPAPPAPPANPPEPAPTS